MCYVDADHRPRKDGGEICVFKILRKAKRVETEQEASSRGEKGSLRTATQGAASTERASASSTLAP